MSDKHQFILSPMNQDYPLIMVRDRVLTIGRSETCDYTVNNQFLSFVHASLLKKGDKLIATDLDSTNGIFINDERVPTGELKDGDILRFGSIRYKVEHRELKQSYPHLPENTDTQKLMKDEVVISGLTSSRIKNSLREVSIPMSREATTIINSDDFETLRPSTNQEQTIIGLFPQFEFSEFIFEEDIEGSAFDLNDREKSLEVTSLFGNCIHEVDYFVSSEKKLVLTAKTGEENKIAVPIMGLNEDLKLAESIGDDKFRLLKTDFFDYKIYTAEGVKTDCFLTQDTYDLDTNDLVVISNDNLKIYLKQTDSPPPTKKVKFFDRDKLLVWLFSFFAIFWLLFIGLLFVFEPEEKPKDPEKISKKIDRILYKKKIIKPLRAKIEDKEASDKTEVDNTIVDNKQKKKLIREDEPREEEVEREPVEEETEEEPTQVEGKDDVKEKVIAPSPPVLDPEPVEDPKPAKAQKISKKVVRTSLKTKKVISPATKIKSLTSKYSQALSNISSNTSKSKSSKKLRKSITQTTGKAGKQDVSFIANKRRKSNVLRGKRIGNFGTGKVNAGSSGRVIGLKNSIARKTVILGMLDPRDVQNVLRKHLPRFSYCYDLELERKNTRFSTTIDLKFTITEKGRAIKPSFTTKKLTFSSKAIRCFRKVISTIQFPKPRGGGIVKVRQPINLEPK